MNLQKPHLIKLHQDIAQMPQDHISIDLLGPYNVTSQDNSYALNAVCNLKGYLITSPIKDKKTITVATHLFLEIMDKFGFPGYYILIMGQNLNPNQLKISLNSLV